MLASIAGGNAEKLANEKASNNRGRAPASYSNASIIEGMRWCGKYSGKTGSNARQLTRGKCEETAKTAGPESEVNGLF